MLVHSFVEMLSEPPENISCGLLVRPHSYPYLAYPNFFFCAVAGQSAKIHVPLVYSSTCMCMWILISKIMHMHSGTSAGTYMYIHTCTVHACTCTCTLYAHIVLTECSASRVSVRHCCLLPLCEQIRIWHQVHGGGILNEPCSSPTQGAWELCCGLLCDSWQGDQRENHIYM